MFVLLLVFRMSLQPWFYTTTFISKFEPTILYFVYFNLCINTYVNLIYFKAKYTATMRQARPTTPASSYVIMFIWSSKNVQGVSVVYSTVTTVVGGIVIVTGTVDDNPPVSSAFNVHLGSREEDRH